MPEHHPEIRDQHIADLRDALTQALALLAFSAGHLAAGDPKFAAEIMATADEMTEILTRTGPEPRIRGDVGGGG